MTCNKLIEWQEWLAMAPPSDQQGGGGIMDFAPMILILVALYFLIIAPQRKKQKQHDKMVQTLEKGARVKTLGGIFGTVTGVKDDRFVLRIGENMKIEVAKEAIAAKID
ncbi:MAG: preprotein translocase subunit YajC [Opitutae bacterium]|nr:preprotein translocase subunit YajC [Opitutae bacterium]MBT4666104.1 preprotein translocase subunit YajC [Opitutae bacterium]MBT7743276.1 preprotein translocase subunit YajC [Opitutae bacterium]MBT7924524.1 preprotein translocase subunit YajC [Opitutae bacterium]